MDEEAGSLPSSLLLLPQQPEQPQSFPEKFLCKSRLQEFTQRASIPLPIYHTKYKGVPPQAPSFTSTVQVDGETYTSATACSNKKAAEQDAARIALEGISKKIKNCISKKTTEGGFPPIYQDKVFCKSILHEFSMKMNIEKPEYDTVRSEGVIPVFISSLVFKGVKYVGQPSVNKKEAEQLAARAVILSILAKTGEGMHLSEIIKSKAKLFSAVHQHNHVNVDSDSISQAEDNVNGGALALLEQSSKKEAEADQANDGTGSVVALSLSEQSSEKNDQISNGIGCAVVEVLQGQSHVLLRHEFRKPVQETETISEPITLPIAFVPSLQVENSLNAFGVKRKSKRKKKANKKAKTETQ
ncbi:hypothetical protein SOVF_085960 [Spinacia oleracea]|nr:hypothetical protein SOVF_085960 [Spinacia oleracea]